ncbi:hypothetical protein GH714_038082 [Hevea brasiliensis]|uniref:NAC domain-containing protein n=1 Tax=Hevea brasiliensis TaxID=3981 RepID=A0A6A6KNV3_HEVBR|nr:hypothetical protein GH714_038082 [Hevea brasiliensis]
MVFYRGRAPNGRKTDWKMNEYKAIQGESSSSSSTVATLTLRHEFSLCRVYKKSKSLRAFDRRPLGLVVEISEMRAHQSAAIQGDVATASHRNPPMAEISNSPEIRSSSEDHAAIPPQTGDSSSIPMPIDCQPSWEWDLLDWYYGEQN